MLHQEHKVDINELDLRLKAFSAEVRNHNESSDHAISALEAKANQADFHMKELQHRVDHFGDNLTLSSNQIVVESSVGFTKRPTSLFEVLKTCNSNFENINAAVTKHGQDITKNTADIETKADATLAISVETLTTNMNTVKEHLKKEEKQGVNVRFIYFCNLAALNTNCPCRDWRAGDSTCV